MGLFTPGTELRGLSVDQFEALVASARKGAEQRSALAPPRLLKARHFMRWDTGDELLTGRSELVVEPSSGGPSELELSPWSPAIDVSPEATGPALVQAREDGRTSVWIEAGPTTTIVLPWQLRARPGSKGRGYSLDLPATSIASLVFDLPDRWIPQGPSGIQHAPEAGTNTEAGVKPGRMLWRFDGQGGPIDLRLSQRDEGREQRREALIWVSGPTRIDLRETSANWTIEWSVDASPRARREFGFELDPGLRAD